jgi:hypothetical protein
MVRKYNHLYSLPHWFKQSHKINPFFFFFTLKSIPFVTQSYIYIYIYITFTSHYFGETKLITPYFREMTLCSQICKIINIPSFFFFKGIFFIKLKIIEI